MGKRGRRRGGEEGEEGEEDMYSPQQPDPPSRGSSWPCFLLLHVLLRPTLWSFVEGRLLGSRPLTTQQRRNVSPRRSLPRRSQSPRLRKPPRLQCRQRADTDLRAPTFLLLLAGTVALAPWERRAPCESHTRLTSPDDPKPGSKQWHRSPSFLPSPPRDRAEYPTQPPGALKPPADCRPAGRALTPGRALFLGVAAPPSDHPPLSTWCPFFKRRSSVSEGLELRGVSFF